MATRYLIFFGHSGAGTSSVAAHLAAACAEASRKTLLIGCDDDQAPALVCRAPVRHEGWRERLYDLGKGDVGGGGGI